MPFYVNTGQSSYRAFTGTSVPSQRNCAFCSAAGAVNLLLGAGRFTSGDVAKVEGCADDKPDVKSPLFGIDNQLKSVANFVTTNTQLPAKQYGSKADEKDCQEAMAWMNSQPHATVFVVYASGPLLGDRNAVKIINKSHWLNAKKTKQDLVFFDFQTNRQYKGKAFMGKSEFTGSKNASTCKLPFVGVITQNEGGTVSSDLQSNDPNRQTGILDVAKTKLVVLAFSPKKG
jgi:hypothetical protein